MFNKKEPYLLTKIIPLKIDSSQDPTKKVNVGEIKQVFQVTHYDETQLIEGNPRKYPYQQKYLVQCDQFIKIYGNLNNQGFIGEKGYQNYPVKLETTFSATTSNAEVEILKMSPQTINTQVRLSGSSSTSDGKSSNINSSSTTGSTTSQSNSYTGNVNILNPLNDSSSNTFSDSKTKERSKTLGNEHGSNTSYNDSSSNDMSIKDWGAYSSIKEATYSPNWTFAQEFPWDPISYKTLATPPKLNGNQSKLIIPEDILDRIFPKNKTDQTVNILPPSHLALFGFKFISKVQWVIKFQKQEPTVNKFNINTLVSVYTGSHFNNSVYIDQTPVTFTSITNKILSTSLDLGIMALEEIQNNKAPAIIGFMSNKFINEPVVSDGKTANNLFEIKSNANDLIIRENNPKPPYTKGCGFQLSQASIEGIFDTVTNSLQFMVYFKITNNLKSYTLMMKHWKNTSSNVIVNFEINQDPTNAITKFVDSNETKGGENNTLSISLRHLDFGSSNFHDYLQMGLNVIKVSIELKTPPATPTSCYQLRALSIEEG